MVGIGITTKDRLELLQALLDSIYKHTDMSNVLLHIEDDSIERLGVAKRKNNCLRALKDCDYVFLMDDDIEIIKDGWIEFFVKANQNHLLFLNEKQHGKKVEFRGIEYYKNCGGVFMFLTKEIIKKVGAFNEKFMQYGFEHAEYSIRILGEKHEYPMAVGTENYLFAHDYSTPNHKSSITDEEKQKHVRNNWGKFFKEPIKDIYLPL